MDLTRLLTAAEWRSIKTVKHSLWPARVLSIKAPSSSVVNDVMSDLPSSLLKRATRTAILFVVGRNRPHLRVTKQTSRGEALDRRKGCDQRSRMLAGWKQMIGTNRTLAVGWLLLCGAWTYQAAYAQLRSDLIESA